MKYQYTPAGVCSKHIELDIEDGIIRDISVTGGCHGNLQGVASLLRGMPAAEAIARLEGIRCGQKATSCPDQIAKAIKESLAN